MLVVRTWPTPAMRLYNGEAAHGRAQSVRTALRVLPPDFGRGTHTPRLVLGKTIIQREQWRGARQDLLPREIRARHSSCSATGIARSAAWICHAICSLAFPANASQCWSTPPTTFSSSCWTSAKPGSEVVLTEMLPTPDDLWLRDEHDAYCAELRLSAGYATPRSVTEPRVAVSA